MPNKKTEFIKNQPSAGVFPVGCHVSVAGGVWNAPKNAADLGCEIFQVFTRPPQGGKAPELDDRAVERFRAEMQKYGFGGFVVHCPYFINFGSKEPRIFYGSVSVVKQELQRASLLGASYVMTHLGSFKDLGQKEAFKQAKEGLLEVVREHEGMACLLLEISAGGGNIIGDKFEELAELMEPLKAYGSFGGICFDTQHAFASGYDLRTSGSVTETFRQFEKVIGLKWLKMSHVNDSKTELGSRRDRHEHIGEGKIGLGGFGAFLEELHKKNKSGQVFPLILETEHDKVKSDLQNLKALRSKLKK